MTFTNQFGERETHQFDNGTRYRKIESGNKTFYSSCQPNDSLWVSCSQEEWDHEQEAFKSQHFFSQLHKAPTQDNGVHTFKEFQCFGRKICLLQNHGEACTWMYVNGIVKGAITYKGTYLRMRKLIRN